MGEPVIVVSDYVNILPAEDDGASISAALGKAADAMPHVNCPLHIALLTRRQYSLLVRAKALAKSPGDFHESRGHCELAAYRGIRILTHEPMRDLIMATVCP